MLINEATFRLYSTFAEVALQHRLISARDAQTITAALGDLRQKASIDDGGAKSFESVRNFQTDAADFIRLVDFYFGTSAVQGMLLSLSAQSPLRELTAQIDRAAQDFNDKYLLVSTKYFTKGAEVFSAAGMMFSLAEAFHRSVAFLSQKVSELETLPRSFVSVSLDQTFEADFFRALFGRELTSDGAHAGALHYEMINHILSECVHHLESMWEKVLLALQATTHEKVDLDLTFQIENLVTLCHLRTMNGRANVFDKRDTAFYQRAQAQKINALVKVSESSSIILKHLGTNFKRILREHMDLKTSELLGFLACQALLKQEVPMKEAMGAAQNLTQYMNEHGVPFENLVVSELVSFHPRLDETFQKLASEELGGLKNETLLREKFYRKKTTPPRDYV